MKMLELLAQELMSRETVEQLSNMTGTNKTQAKKLVGNAVPILVQAMSDNAGNMSGAESLMGALREHAGNQPVSEQIRQADMVDGDKIVGKILGGNKNEVIKALAKKSGVSKVKATSLLSVLAPVLMSLISTEITSNNTSSGGLSSMLSLFTDDDHGDDNNSTSSSSGLGDIGTAVLMGALLGGNSGSGSGTAGNLMTTLLGANSSGSGSGLGGSLLTSMLGGSGSNSSTGLDGALLNQGQEEEDGMLGSILGSGSGSLLSAMLGGGSSSSNNNKQDLFTSMAASLLSEAFKGGKKSARKGRR